MRDAFLRQDRIEADLCCLMCSRVIGQLSGMVWRDAHGRRTARSVVHLTQFRPSMPGAPSVPVSGRAQLRCPDCGGVGVVEEVVVTPLGESRKLDNGCPVHRDRVRGPGRPPRRCRCGDQQLAA